MAAVSSAELSKAARALKEGIDFCEANTGDRMIYSIARDAVIQRFEFCVELAWKLAKKKMGSTSATAKPVIREMLANRLIENFHEWFEFVEARNKSSHTYDEDIAKEVYLQTKKFVPALNDLMKRLESL